ncbi:MAG: UvrD-helicase domain-containing protein, partial [Chloroflexota bacterium]
MSGFVPSVEQQAIFEAWLNGSGNVAVRAGAGTGKTTTVVELIKRDKTRHSKLVCAFNKDIVREVQPRLDGTGANAKTFHSLGYGPLIKHLKAQYQIDKLDVQGDRYKTLIERQITNAPVSPMAEQLTRVEQRIR